MRTMISDIPIPGFLPPAISLSEQAQTHHTDKVSTTTIVVYRNLCFLYRLQQKRNTSAAQSSAEFASQFWLVSRSENLSDVIKPED